MSSQPFRHNHYTFKSHEMPMMLGSPASPEHPKSRKIAYILIGLWLALVAGLQNGLMTAAQLPLRSTFGLTLEQDGWIQVAYYMTYVCMSIFLFKVRQHFGVTGFLRWLMMMLIVGAGLQWFAHGFMGEILARGVAGLVASGLMVTAIFYFMQALTGSKKLGGALLALGFMLSAMPLAQIIVPIVFADGNIQAVFALSPAVALLSVGCLLALPLPPSQSAPSLSWLDWVSFALLATGIALICGFLVQGRIVWWTTDWLGYLLAGGVGLTGLALWIEYHRQEPMLDLSWLSMPQILMFGFTSALVRVLTSEQNVGAAGLMGALGMTGQTMMGFYTVVFAASVLGVIMSLLRLDIADIRRPVVVSLLGLTIGAYLDTQVGVMTRPAQLYISQAIIAFSALYFLGPMLLEGLARALAKSPNHIMSFSAVFSLSQSVGGLAGAALFSSFVTVRTREHLGEIAGHLSLTDPNVVAQIGMVARAYVPLSNDMVVLQGQGVSAVVSQAVREATVLAFHDLFALLAFISAMAFAYTFTTWAYRKKRGIDILAEEKRRLAALLK